MLKSELLNTTGLAEKDLNRALRKIERTDLIQDTDLDIPDEIALSMMEAADRVERKEPVPDPTKLNGSALALSPEDAIANSEVQYRATVASIMETLLNQAIDVGASRAEILHAVESHAFDATLSNLRSRSAQSHLDREADALARTVETLDLAAQLKARGIDPNGYYGVASNLKTEDLSQLRNRVSQWNGKR